MKNYAINRAQCLRILLIFLVLLLIFYVIKVPSDVQSGSQFDRIENDVDFNSIDKFGEKLESAYQKSVIIPASKTIIAKTTTTQNPLTSLKNLLKCTDKEYEPKLIQHGDYWLLRNYVRTDNFFACHETITYTTHSDFTFLENVIPLLERWEAPLSVALYAPGDDFDVTLRLILFLRNCHLQGYLVQQYATFHIFFDAKFIPKNIPRDFFAEEKSFFCPDVEPDWNFPRNRTFKMQKSLPYPVNIGRNLARDAALTHFVLASDIELYPSRNLIEKFFEMILMRNFKINLLKKSVFVLPIFELDAASAVPSNKTELQELYNQNLAVWFHFKICATCHTIPKAKEWIEANDKGPMNIFTTSKRHGKFDHWEPLFIGTNLEPLYDERLSWEGKSDKMTQAYVMCLIDYDFRILSNAFLMHRPGIKTLNEAKREKLETENKELIMKTILPELQIFYGKRRGCKMYD